MDGLKIRRLFADHEVGVAIFVSTVIAFVIGIGMIVCGVQPFKEQSDSLNRSTNSNSGDDLYMMHQIGVFQ